MEVDNNDESFRIPHITRRATTMRDIRGATEPADRERELSVRGAAVEHEEPEPGRGVLSLSQTFQTSSHTSDSVSAVAFHSDGTQVFGGTSRGVVYACDVVSGKSSLFSPVSRKLAGHVSEVTAIATDPVMPHLVVTASADASVRLWDVRESSQVRTFKGHQGQVNSCKLSPNGEWVASAGNDRIVQVLSPQQVWNAASGESLKKFDSHKAPVTCLLFHPADIKLASAGLDKKSIVWDLDTMQFQAETKQEATPIEAISFDSDGNYLFTASNESLKVWTVGESISLQNSVPTKWRGVKDLKISPDRQHVLTLSAGPKSFTCWWTDFLKAPASPMSGSEEDDMGGRQRGDRHPPRRVLSRDNIPNEDLPAGNLTESSNEKFNMMESFAEIRREHKKFCVAMEQKHNNLAPIFTWLGSPSTLKAAINAIESKVDPMVLVDLINMVIQTKKVDTMNIEFATVLLRKAAILAESNYIIHIKSGMAFVSTCVAKFKSVDKSYIGNHLSEEHWPKTS
jgi:hypothetical protein